MKKFLICLLALTLSFAAESSFAQTSSHAGEAITAEGVTMPVMAATPSEFPAPLTTLRVIARPVEESAVRAAMEGRFTGSPDLAFTSEGHAFDLIGAQGLPTESFIPDEYARSWQCDERLGSLVTACSDFLTALQINHLSTPVYACYFDAKCNAIPLSELASDQEYQMSVMLAPTFLGVPMDYEGISNRGDGYVEGRPDITHQAFAAFLFNREGQLTYAHVPTLAIADEAQTDGVATSWQNAAQAALREYLRYVDAMGGAPAQPLAELGADDRGAFFAKYEPRLTRLTPVWLDDWTGYLRLGWFARIELYDRETSTLVWNTISGENDDSFRIPFRFSCVFEADTLVSQVDPT